MFYNFALPFQVSQKNIGPNTEGLVYQDAKNMYFCTKNGTMVRHVYIYILSPKYYSNHKHHLTSITTPQSQSHSSYNPPLNVFTNIFIIITNFNNYLICVMMSFMLPTKVENFKA